MAVVSRNIDWMRAIEHSICGASGVDIKKCMYIRSIVKDSSSVNFKKKF